MLSIYTERTFTIQHTHTAHRVEIVAKKQQKKALKYFPSSSDEEAIKYQCWNVFNSFQTKMSNRNSNRIEIL